MAVLSTNTASQLPHLNCLIQALQQFQQLLATDATLADVSHLLTYVEANYGEDKPLEDVIQYLVSEHLALQIKHREATRCHTFEPKYSW